MKINRYIYLCSDCSYEYIEQRRESEDQYKTKCPACNGELTLNDTVFVEDEATTL
jgi:peptide subunit release factor 1 (eRF1)